MNPGLICSSFGCCVYDVPGKPAMLWGVYLLIVAPGSLPPLTAHALLGYPGAYLDPRGAAKYNIMASGVHGLTWNTLTPLYMQDED